MDLPPLGDDPFLARHLPLIPRAAQRLDTGAEIARGGMGAVLEVRESATRRTVAMKVMLRGGDPKATLRFIEEAQVTAQLEHPNIVPVHELGVDEHGQPFYTMKRVAGITLKQVLAELKQRTLEAARKYPLVMLITVFQKVCDAIAFAHSRGVIHRDLKPANIMLGRFGEVLVMDWGLAKIVRPCGGDAGEDSALNVVAEIVGVRSEESEIFSTLDGSLMGTPHYMSPEQARGEVAKLDARSDIFSLGTILYEILTLERPFTGRGLPDILEKITTGDFLPPGKALAAEASTRRQPRFVSLPDDGIAGAGVEVAPARSKGARQMSHLPGNRVPRSLDAVVCKAMALDPERRYSSVTEFQADLTAYQSGFATGAEEKTAWVQLKLLIKRHKAVAGSMAAALVLIAGISTAFTLRVVAERNRAETALADLRNSAPLYAAEADAHIQKQQFTEALQKIAAAIACDQRVADYHSMKGNIMEALLRLSEAREAYAAALARDPAHPVALPNARLCDEIIKADGPGKPSVASVAKLNALMREQGRTTEALALAPFLRENRAHLFATWHDALAKAGFREPPPNWIFLDEDGLFGLRYENLPLGNIAVL